MNKKLLKTIRVLLAAICFALITLLLLDFTGVLRHYLTFMAKIQFLPAVMALNFAVIIALIVLTLLFGRIYCSVICPLGVYQDVVSHIHSVRKKNRFRFHKEMKFLRYGIFVLFIVAMLVGVNSFVALLAPYSSWGRMVQNLFQPLYIWINNFFAFLSERADSYTFYTKDVWIRSVSTFIIAAVSFAVITFLAWRTGRTYCNSVCPVGTVLSFFARFSFFKIRIDQTKCIKCDKCTKNCKANCINGKEHYVDYSRCVVCGNCQSVCPKEAIKFSKSNFVRTKSTTTTPQSNVNESKRAFLFSSVLMATTLAFAQDKKKTDGGLAIIENKKTYKRTTEVVPAGAKSLKNLQTRCTGCQLCVSKCPNNVLRPSQDLLHFMQPVMSFEKGACRVECTTCSLVCPAGAIQKITKEEKTAIQTGVAKWVKHNCVVVNNDHNCGNCARHCPNGAIIMVPYVKPQHENTNGNAEIKNSTAALDPQEDKKLMIPTVNESRCIGCGMCEYVCPSRPYSAIYVEGLEIHKNI